MKLNPIPKAREFAIMYSRLCNIECAHCGIDSSPRVKEHMELEDARRLIVEAATIEDFGKVTFTGGEPFMFPHELESLIELCTTLNLDSRVVTNGFWAKNMDRGMDILSKMKKAGLGELNFSADRFHLDFLPASTLRNALECAHRLGFRRIVSFVNNGEKDPLDDFSELYQVPRASLLDLRLILHDEELIRSFQDENIFIYYGGVIGLGRSEQRVPDLHSYPLDYFTEGSPCGEIVNKPVIYPDGTFQACCCAGGKIKSFTVGNVWETSLTELYEKMQRRSHFRIINTHGPRTLMNCVKQSRPDVIIQDTFTSICELCVKATAQLTPTEVDSIADEFLLMETLKSLGLTTTNNVLEHIHVDNEHRQNTPD
jgi:hypothetical protein